MVKTQYIAALEIGSSKIVGAIAEKSPSGYVQVNHLEVEKLVNSVRHGCIQNVENTKGAINNIIKRNLITYNMITRTNLCILILVNLNMT